MGADPYDQYRGAVHNQHDQRHQTCHGTCGEQMVFRISPFAFANSHSHISDYWRHGWPAFHPEFHERRNSACPSASAASELRHNKGECHHHDTQNEHNDKCDVHVMDTLVFTTLITAPIPMIDIDDNTQNHYQRHLNLDIISGVCNQRIRGEFIKFSTGEVFNLIETSCAGFWIHLPRYALPESRQQLPQPQSQALPPAS